MSTLPAGPEAIAAAAAALARGELVAFPTETVYGLGADATNEAAVGAVYRLKGRPSSHPLIVHLPSADALWLWADRRAQAREGFAPELVEALAEAAWPGPLTLVLRARATVLPAVTGSQDTVALRVPGNDTALALLGAFGGAVVAPSANRFGYVSPTTAQHVAAGFPGDLLIIDAGPTELGIESTILDLSTRQPRLLRPGGMSLARLEELLGVPVARERRGHAGTTEGASAAALAERVGAEASLAGAGAAVGSGQPRAPGTLAQHYAPRRPLRLVGRGELADAAAAAGNAVIARRPPPPGAAARWLELPADARGFGRLLYAAMREVDAVGAAGSGGEILVELPPEGEEWLAVRDRLERAAAAHAPAGKGPSAGDTAPTGEGVSAGGTTPAGEPAPSVGSAPAAAASTGDSAAGVGPTGATRLVAVVMGSTSDWETMRHADEVLTSFGVPHDCQVVSAHRTPAKMAAFAAGAAAAGYRVIIAGAGGAAHLPGMLAAQTHLPVLGVPVRGAALGGVDSLLSQVQMPRGVPVGTLAIGPAGAVNAALLAVAILALSDEGLESELIAYRARQTAAAEAMTLPGPDPAR